MQLEASVVVQGTQESFWQQLVYTKFWSIGKFKNLQYQNFVQLWNHKKVVLLKFFLIKPLFLWFHNLMIVLQFRIILLFYKQRVIDKLTYLCEQIKISSLLMTFLSIPLINYPYLKGKPSERNHAWGLTSHAFHQSAWLGRQLLQRPSPWRHPSHWGHARKR